jgi:amino acid adenylation domain-containing protein
MARDSRPIGGALPRALGDVVEGTPVTATREFVRFEKNEIEQSIPERFERQVRKYSNQVAIKANGQSATYSELNRTANQIGRGILAQCKGSANAVGLLLEKSVPMMAAMLGALKAARTYVPLDPAHPAARLGHILDDAETELIVTNNRFLSFAQPMARDGRRLLNVDEDVSGFSSGDIGLPVNPDAPCYIIYTSGSTGEPKGVVQNHRNVLHNIMRHTNSLRLCAADRLTLLASCATGQAVTGIYGALLNGASVYAFDVKEEGFTRLAAWLAENEITVYHSSASVFRNFAESLSGDEDFSTLRFIKLGSEPVSKREVELFRKNFASGCVLVNTLSSTEAGPVRQYMMANSAGSDGNVAGNMAGNIVPVGFPLDDLRVRLLDQAGEEVGVDAVGEICIESPYVSPGYWRRPELTSRSFSPSPAAEGQRIYRSGDVGRMDREGCLTYLGRKDSRVKIRGFAVEIAEVEAALRSIAGISDMAVVAQDCGNEQRLVAYVVPRQGLTLSVTTMRKHLSGLLPEFMIPSVFVTLEVLPRTPGGKIDRSALPTIQVSRPGLDTPLVNARTPFEQSVAALWMDVLGISPVGVNDNFFELGGTSLKAAQVLSRLQRAYDMDVSMRSFFESPTVAGLAQAAVHKKAEGMDQADVLRFLHELTGS